MLNFKNYFVYLRCRVKEWEGDGEGERDVSMH